jgi:hypothetical protein
MKRVLAVMALCFPLTPLLPAQTMQPDSPGDTVLFDFAQRTNAAWQVVNDDVMGGVSTSRFELTNGFAVFRGVVSLENNGGFASVRAWPTPSALREATEFILRVRGDGRRYKFTARMDASFDGPLYQIAFTTSKDEWQEVRLPLKEFVPTFRGRVLGAEPPLSANKVTSVGFLISDRQEGPFRLEIAWIKYRNHPAPSH